MKYTTSEVTAAITLSNSKTDKLAEYYGQHKAVIDGYHKLQKEASFARFQAQMIRARQSKELDDVPF